MRDGAPAAAPSTIQGMPTSRRAFAAVLTAALFAAPVAACSSSESSQPLPEAATLLQESSQTTRDQTSVHLELSVMGTIDDLPIKTLSADLTNTPAVGANGNARLTMGGNDADVDFVVTGGTLYGALTADHWIDFGPAADIYDVSAILNPDTGLANVLTNFEEAKADGRETINDVQTVRITGTVKPDAVNKVAPQIEATEPVPGTAWIREDGDHALMQAKLEPTPGNAIQMTLSKWGEPVTVTKPPV